MPCFFLKWNICISNANFKTTHLFGSVACLSVRSWLPAIQAAYCIASIPASQQCSSTHHTCKVSSAAMSINQNYLIVCPFSTPKNTHYHPILAFVTTHIFISNSCVIFHIPPPFMTSPRNVPGGELGLTNVQGERFRQTILNGCGGIIHHLGFIATLSRQHTTSQTLPSGNIAMEYPYI